MNAASRVKNEPDGSTHAGSNRGFLLGLAAYTLWGVLPLYFKAVADVPPIDIVAHRVLWSLPFLAILIGLGKGWSKVRATAMPSKTLAVLALTALLIGGNWLLYTYAVVSG